MAQVDLQGSGSATANGDGDIDAVVGLSGAGVANGLGVGSLSVIRDFLGFGQGTANGSGTVSRRTDVDGDGTGTATGNGSLSSTVLLAGEGVATAQGGGSLGVNVPLSGSGEATAVGGGLLSAVRDLFGSGTATAQGEGDVSRRVSLDGDGTAKATGSGSLRINVLLGGGGQATAAGAGTLTRSTSIEGSGTGTAGGQVSLNLRKVLGGSGAGTAQGSVSLLRRTDFFGEGVAEAFGSGELGDIKSHWVFVNGSVESEDAGASLNVTGLDTSVVHVFQVAALDTAYNFSTPATLRVSPLSTSVQSTDRTSVSLQLETPDPSLYDSIKLYRANSQGGPYQEINEFTSLSETISYTDSGLNADTDYYYYAEALGGSSAVDVESSEISASTAKPLRKATGHLQVSSTGQVEVSGLGFEPDLIAFEVAANRNAYGADDELTGEEWGWGYGYAHIPDGKDFAMAVASGSSSTNGQHTETTTSYSVFLPVTANDGASVDGYIRAKVKSTDGDGFVLQFDDADRSWHLNWTAYQFGPNGEAEIGFESTPGSTGQQSYTTGFQPNFLRTICQPHAAIQSGDDSVTDAKENGWGHGVAAERGGTIEQVSASVVMYSENINMHAWGSSDSDALYTVIVDSNETVSGRIRAALSSFDANGFTLDYDSVESGQPFLYCAMKTDASPEVGYGRTPTSTGPQSISTAIAPDLLKVLASNTIEDIDIEGDIPLNSNDGHHGWMQGIAKYVGGQFSQGFSSHSNSVNGHAAGGNDTQGFHLLYTDDDGVILGRDQATVNGLGSSGFELDFSEVVTTSTTDVRLDRTLFIYWAFT